MKISKIVLCAAILFAFALAPQLPAAHAELGTISWQNTAFKGSDPFYSSTVSAYQTGSTATLYIPVTYQNPYGGLYINVTGATLKMDWNGNYTASGLPIKIDQNGWAPVTITFTVPATNVASNLWTHSGVLTVNYTTPASSGTKQFFGSVPTFAAYSSDQASAMSIMQQLGAISGGFGSPCGGLGSSGFKTAAGTADCQQAVQQYVYGRSLYVAGNFTQSNNAFKNAQTDWNNAISADSGSAVDLGTTLGSYGLLLLGIGGVIAAIAVLIYALRRPKELRALAASTTH